jgi:tRNA(fMet)-specific endonuclease VapC
MTLFDTDVCIEILRGNEVIIQRREKQNDTVAVSFMTVGELYYGASKSEQPEKNNELVEQLLLTLEVVQSDADIMKRFGEIKASLAKRNEILADADIIIGATALEKCEKLITGNVQHFKRIENLRIENWTK